MHPDGYTTSMDIPDLVEGALDGEEIQATVSLGDEDAVCLTPTRTLIYRGEGLLSDEAVEEYSHDVEQLAVSEGRRKTKFTMQYIDGTDSFTVPANRGETVLEQFLENVLRRDGVVEARESLAGVYRFSELTLIIAEGRLIKHIGNQVWSEDYEVYPYESVTGLDFERASVATSIALSVDGRPQRIKVPNDKAPVVRQTLEGALFEFYGVGSIDELNRAVGPDDESPPTAGVEDDAADDGFAFGDDFDPLVSDEDEPLTEPVGDDQLASDPGTADPADPGQPQRGTQPSEGTPQGDPSRGGPSQRGSATADDRRPDGRSGGPAESRSAGGSQPDQPERSSDERGHSGAEPDRTGDDRDRVRDASSGAQQSSASDPQQPSGSEPQQPSDSASSRSQSTDTGTAESQPNADRSADSQSRDAPTGNASSGPAAAERTQSSASATGDGPGTETAGGRAEDTGVPADSTADAPVRETDAADSEPAPVTRAEYEAMVERLDELTDAVDRQNELLKRQHRALKRLAKQHEQTE